VIPRTVWALAFAALTVLLLTAMTSYRPAPRPEPVGPVAPAPVITRAPEPQPLAAPLEVVAEVMAPEPEPETDRRCFKNCRLSESGLSMIASFEGYMPYTYKDVAGYPTIGYGHLIKAGERFREPLMPEQALELLHADAAIFERAVNQGVSVPLHGHQYDALVSITFNVGPGGKYRDGIIRLRSGTPSTLLRKVNAELHPEVPPQFMRWVNAGGKPIRGLKLRRAAEGKTYQGG
jgi:lysozyme